MLGYPRHWLGAHRATSNTEELSAVFHATPSTQPTHRATTLYPIVFIVLNCLRPASLNRLQSYTLSLASISSLTRWSATILLSPSPGLWPTPTQTTPWPKEMLKQISSGVCGSPPLDAIPRFRLPALASRSSVVSLSPRPRLLRRS